MSVDYDELINRTWEDVPEPELLPEGGWLLVGTNVGLVKPKKEGDKLRILWSYKPKEPVAVAQELLDELGDYDFTVNTLTFTQWIEAPSDWDEVRKHAHKHGFEIDPKARIVENGKLSFSKAFRGSEVVADVGQKPFTRSSGESTMENTLSKFQAVEE